jgi:adenylate kinase
MFNLILFGPPGSGKGTQSENIIAAFGLKHLSTGNLLRSEITQQTPLGLEAKNFMDQGQLVPDAVVIGMVGNFIDANPEAKGFLFDGFPRTAAQCVALDALLKEKSSEINIVLALCVINYGNKIGMLILILIIIAPLVIQSTIVFVVFLFRHLTCK